MELPAELEAAARRAARTAWRRGSARPRGAALWCGAGVIQAAPELDDPGDGTGGCAERSAILLARLAGHGRPRHLLLRAGRRGTGDAGPPCGACLQILHEFAPALRIYWGTPLRPRSATLKELLPGAFGPGDLARAASEPPPPTPPLRRRR